MLEVMYMIRKKIKLFGVALDLFILDDFDENEVNSILLLLLANNQLKSGDVVTFGKKGLRVNHEPKDVVDGYLVDRPTGYQKKGRRRGYNSIGVGQFHRKGCKYRIDKSSVILTTNGQNKVDFIIDVDDFNLVRKYSWAARKAKDHIAVFYSPMR